jgi:hypothetical protein
MWRTQSAQVRALYAELKSHASAASTISGACARLQHTNGDSKSVTIGRGTALAEEKLD